MDDREEWKRDRVRAWLAPAKPGANAVAWRRWA